jgi:hypothetical protein
LQVLTDPQRRAAYDADHAGLPGRGLRNSTTPGSRMDDDPGVDDAPRPRRTQSNRCPFCGLAPRSNAVDSCPRCTAPLTPPQAVACLAGDQRRYARLAHNAPVWIHTEWPKRVGIPGRLRDLSLGGVQAAIAGQLSPGQVVLLSSGLLDAVGRVASCAAAGGESLAGIAFLTLRIHEPRGTFVSARA